MKKFLSILGASVLSLSLLAGCGASEKDAEDAAAKLVSTITSISQEASKLDADSLKELQEVQKEMQSVTALTKDSDYDAVIEKVNSLDSKLREIASKNGIEIKEMSADELKDKLGK